MIAKQENSESTRGEDKSECAVWSCEPHRPPTVTQIGRSEIPVDVERGVGVDLTKR